jgi:DNA polymerase-1
MTAKEAKRRLVLLDAHAILHRAYHALPEFSSSKGEPTGALYGLSAMLIKIIADLKPDYLIAAYDLPKPTYRHEVYKDYKAGRPKAEPELVSQMKRSREVFGAFGIPIYDKEGFEADDILGTIVEKLRPEKNFEIIIASGDMDTAQLVEGERVRVYTLKKGLNDTILYDEKAVVARYGFSPKLLPDYKGLSGDPSDNIIGVKGIGDKTATSLIQKFGAIEEIYKALKTDRQLFISQGFKPRTAALLEAGEEEAEFSKILATIRRDAPIDFSLPDKKWSEGIDFGKTTALFGELEFRTLGGRLKEVLNESAGKEPGGGAGKPNGAEPKTLFEKPKETEFAETAIGLWLLNSSITKPALDDILNFTKKATFSEAREAVLSELKKKNLENVFERIEKPLLPVVRRMNERGVKIDVRCLQKLGGEYHKTLDSLEQKIWRLAGGQFNLNSPKQLAETLFLKIGLKVKNQKKTSTGNLSTRESELEKIRDLHPVIPLILEYRQVAKLLSTYIDNIPAMVAADGRLRANFIQSGTTTGRMSSENPNLQNIPNHTELGRRIRNAFVAADGFKLVAFDYSQIELRVAAFLSGDRTLIKIFKNGEDIHAAVAAEVFGVGSAEVTKEMRRQAKVINFGVMYGMGVNTLRQNLGTDRKTAKEFYDSYFNNFSGLAKYLDRLKAEAERRGFSETFFGRRRYFEGIKSPLPFIKAAAERMAINAPIQGTEADIIKLAMVRVDDFINAEKLADDVRLLLQVHDELVYEIKEGLVEKLAPRIKKIMESAISLEETIGVPIVVDLSVGENWGEMKKFG